MKTNLTTCLTNSFSHEGIHSLGTGSRFQWQKNYLAYDPQKGWSIVRLHLLERIWRALGGYKKTHLPYVMKRLKKEKELSPPLISHMNALWAKTYPNQPIPLKLPLRPSFKENACPPPPPLRDTPPPPSPRASAEMKKLIQELVEQGVEEEDIYSTLSDSGLEKRLIETLVKAMKEKKTSDALSHVHSSHSSSLPMPTLVIAKEGINQYQGGGPAACTSIACRFLASKQATSPEAIYDAIHSNTYKESRFEETEECLARYKELQLVENPLKKQKEISPNSMQVGFTAKEIKKAIKKILLTDQVNGALITANGVTLALRKQGSTLEFFDSHGDHELTQQGNAAYVKTCQDQDSAVGFLLKRFPDIGFSPVIEITLVQIL